MGTLTLRDMLSGHVVGIDGNAPAVKGGEKEVLNWRDEEHSFTR